MRGGLRIAMAALVVAILAWIGWISIEATQVDELAETDPAAALRLDPDHPRALLRMAWRQLGRNEPDAASATARHLLVVEPGQGDAFAVLAVAAARRGDVDADKLAAIALHRAPRNRDLRTQQAAIALKAGDLPAALGQIDALLRLSPGRGRVLFPAMAEQAAAPAFANALAATLTALPPWRTSFLMVLNSKGTPTAVDHVYSALLQRGELDDAETGRWLDRMISDGRWGEAYAHWVGTLGTIDGGLAPVRNGGFENEPTGLGFDWRNDHVAGAFTDLEPAAGADGKAAHIHFLGRPVARGNLRQALLLAPGHFRLSLRARAEFLRSDQGLTWIIRCGNKGQTIAVVELLEENFAWRTIGVNFQVPAEGCPGQWLELINPAVSGSAQQVTGDLWVDDVAITPVEASSLP